MNAFKTKFRQMLPLYGRRSNSFTRRLREMRTFYVLLNPIRRRKMRDAFERCQTCEDYLRFTVQWMHGGAMQNAAEIGPALEAITRIEPRRICEIGTAHCGTTLLLAHVPPSIETVVGIDLYIRNTGYLKMLRRPS